MEKGTMRSAGLKVLFKLMSASMLILLVFPIAGSACAVSEAGVEEAKVKLIEAFEAVAEAERMGGSATGLVAELNEALTLIEEGEACGND